MKQFCVIDRYEIELMELVAIEVLKLSLNH